ncbi:MAG: hypothetical protein Q4G67_11880 [Actinomycetia bacterium]|nr:hypothetical protein [Actinomycetes bacterium]
MDKNSTPITAMSPRRKAEIGRIYAAVGALGVVLSVLAYFLLGMSVPLAVAGSTSVVLILVGIPMAVLYGRQARSTDSPSS